MSMPISALLLDCQNAVKAKKYGAALDTLKSALRAAHNDGKADHVNILDHRVAVYLSMESLDLALKDAKDMIRHDRKDGRGYLRCGQIERLLGNQTAAINWYKQGLKRVPSGQRSFLSLQKQMEKVESQVQQALVFTKASDPMLTMPLETVELILSFLSYKQIISLLRVSKSWNKLLSSLPPLIDTIDYQAPKRPINLSMLRATLRKLKVPRSITATQMYPEARQELVRKLRSWKNFKELSHLELRLDEYPPEGLPFQEYKLKSLVLSAASTNTTGNLNIDIYGDVLPKCPSLEVLVLRNLRGNVTSPRLSSPALCLRKLVIHTENGSSSTASAYNITTNMPNLREVSLQAVWLITDDTRIGRQITDLRCLEGLETLHLNPGCITYQLCLPAQIQNLRIHYLGYHIYRGSDDPPLTRLTNLRTLDLKLKEWPTCLESNYLPTEVETNLAELCLDVDVSLERQGLELLEHGCVKRLRHLQFTCQRLTDSHSASFIEHMPQLETLTLRDAAITGVFIMDLLKTPTCRLREVHLQGCLTVSGDIVPWAKARGVNLTIKKNVELAKGQRRVREG
ncbi:uncharacterized protein A1O9_06870 [Exophiala aquamarina CBS 119918]|uniref:F-box domain-containing protein n=1 Tax=Exophiala aquamarina CBS 119918 TaxID=1182545 RepID=A0A072P9Z1_9EURO|nr:uncharacterized protein A1O9_06870 [Exophiala aquamarina CBS 119918]KEF56681.1 hypothetical protein A1O9_06870 [Exophiala aquamarina CBS 119918]